MRRKKLRPSPKTTLPPTQQAKKSLWTPDRRAFLLVTYGALLTWALPYLFPAPAPQQPATRPIAVQPSRNQVVTPAPAAIKVHVSEPVLRVSESLHVQVMRPQVASHNATNSSTTNLRDYLRD